MRLNLLHNLRTLGNTALGSICSYAPVSLPDNDYFYENNLSKICGRLRC